MSFGDYIVRRERCSWCEQTRKKNWSDALYTVKRLEYISWSQKAQTYPKLDLGALQISAFCSISKMCCWQVHWETETGDEGEGILGLTPAEFEGVCSNGQDGLCAGPSWRSCKAFSGNRNRQKSVVLFFLFLSRHDFSPTPRKHLNCEVVLGSDITLIKYWIWQRHCNACFVDPASTGLSVGTTFEPFEHVFQKIKQLFSLMKLPAEKSIKTWEWEKCNVSFAVSQKWRFLMCGGIQFYWLVK